MRTRRIHRPALLLFLTFLPAILLAQGEPAAVAYVTDVLRLGLYRTDDTEVRPFRTLLSGTQLVILERRTFLARVRTPDGEEGWVKSNFLQNEKPAALRASEYEAQIGKLNADLEQARASLDEANSAVSRIRTAASDATALQQETDSLRSENAALKGQLGVYASSLPLKWSLVLAGIVAVLAFFAGIAFLDYRIRKRHGGFRVY